MTRPDLTGLHAELIELLGERGVSTDLGTRQRASVDGCPMSPILSAQLPLGLADLVAYPSSAEEIGQVVAAAYRHDVPVTPRGKGTANYGQGLPLHDGLVLDTTRARRVLEVGDGWITAEAGAVIAMMEAAARQSGQELLMYPSTAQSTIAGFLSGGSGGTGSIEHGTISSSDFVQALDVVEMTGSPELVHITGDDIQTYLHTYGTVGIIAKVTVKLEPLRDWRCFYASFEEFQPALDLIRVFGDMEPSPRLMSADRPLMVNALPLHPGLPRDRVSLRGIVRADEVARASRLVEEVGGRVDAVIDDAQEMIRMSMMSYNHTIEWTQKAYPDTYFHVELVGQALIDRVDEVEAVYPGGVLHIEAQKDRPLGLLVGEFESAEAVYAGYGKYAEMGVFVHSPHQWTVDNNPGRAMARAARSDPKGLLNPGKLVEGAVVNQVMTTDNS
ncbi:FAD-binding oxidoreductase [Nocardioides sp. zg-ZUI104]|uniref:FAD-binding oxidoreductase n=1 Tax=Nocardioides faecalis TaxID=2803858 RepID=UPI001BD1219C|nr:FAD-binding oxidoreductase [Nocardioides faecalis]MBS4753130.1 FAD-binding oxidoreductase [Nocardioides faecalis]